ncbi:hypothetical protein V8F20_011825 [Naviculisporaceae sp. PSN 640]
MAPNPQGSSSAAAAAERTYHGANGKGHQVVAAKMPGTPRRDTGGHRQEKAVQDPGLKDYVSPFLCYSPFCGPSEDKQWKHVRPVPYLAYAPDLSKWAVDYIRGLFVYILDLSVPPFPTRYIASYEPRKVSCSVCDL